MASATVADPFWSTPVRVIVRGQATGVAIGPPLTITPAQLTEIGEAVSAGLDAVAEMAAAASPA